MEMAVGLAVGLAVDLAEDLAVSRHKLLADALSRSDITGL